MTAVPVSVVREENVYAIRGQGVNYGYVHRMEVPCSKISGGFVFTGQVYPGTYKVTVLGGYYQGFNDLPRDAAQVVVDRLKLP